MKKKTGNGMLRCILLGIGIAILTAVVLTVLLSLAVSWEWMPPTILDAASAAIGGIAVFLGAYTASRPQQGKKLVSALAVLGGWLLVCAAVRATVFPRSEIRMHIVLLAEVLACLSAGLLANRSKKRRHRSK